MLALNPQRGTRTGGARAEPATTRMRAQCALVASRLASAELSYLITGKLEIVPQETGVPVIVSPGDFVTFPEGFVSDWTVLEELTWHYYLY